MGSELAAGTAIYAALALSACTLIGEALLSEKETDAPTSTTSAAGGSAGGTGLVGGGMGGVGGSAGDGGVANTGGQGGAGGGCAADLMNDPAHCGACNRPCATGGQCLSGVCWHLCNMGFADCAHPSAPSADDGCETVIETTSCGCGIDCSQTSSTCVLYEDANVYACICGGGTTCGDADDVCEADSCKCYVPGPGPHCRAGEICQSNTCRCNGGAACAGFKINEGPGPDFFQNVCCPSGCADLRISATNCGACGVVCPPGSACVQGQCQ